MRFSVTKGEVEFYEPAVFTTCIQEDEKDGYWMIPFVEDDEEEEEGNEEDDDDEKWSFAARSNKYECNHLRNKKLYLIIN